MWRGRSGDHLHAIPRSSLRKRPFSGPSIAHTLDDEYVPTSSSSFCSHPHWHEHLLAPIKSTMSTQHHSLAVTLESIHVLTVDTTGARNITRDATPANLSGQGDGIQSALAGTFMNAAGWTNVLSELSQTRFEDNAARRVVADFTTFVTLYADLMAALAEQRDLLVSPGSPFAPDGAVVGQLITVLHFAIWALHTWLRAFSPTRVAEIRAQWERAAAAFELAASQYPRPGKSRAELVKAVCGNLKITVLEAPTQD